MPMGSNSTGEFVNIALDARSWHRKSKPDAIKDMRLPWPVDRLVLPVPSGAPMSSRIMPAWPMPDARQPGAAVEVRLNRE